MLGRAARLQTTRVCLCLVTGQAYPGEEAHPEDCPCAEDRRRREADAEARRRLEERRRAEAEDRERLIRDRKHRFYARMKHVAVVAGMAKSNVDEEGKSKGGGALLLANSYLQF